MKRLFLGALFLVFLGSCSQNSSQNYLVHTLQNIRGRDNGRTEVRPLLYQAYTKSDWIREDPPIEGSIADTTLAICTFGVREQNEEIRITIHTFPITKEELRTLPQRQIDRWKNQLEQVHAHTTYITKESWSGFSGLFFEATGTMGKKPTTMLAWSMQLAPSYVRKLRRKKSSLDEYRLADYTIKATGAPEIIKKYRTEIIAFAHSFGLIDELPSPL